MFKARLKFIKYIMIRYDLVYDNLIMTVLKHIKKGVYQARQLFKLPQNLCGILGTDGRFESSFVPKRVLILTKISRYEIERLTNPDLSEDQLRQKIVSQGTNYEALLAGHHRNKATELRTIKVLKHLNITYLLRDRYNIDIDSITWADLIVPIGGDGTFLLTSNLICNNNKPILGINSDPEFSEGFLMLPSKYTNNITEIFEKLKRGNFKYLMRTRIRITLCGENIWQIPFHMHETNKSVKDKKFHVNYNNLNIPKGKIPKVRQLPWLALNEVFIGESLSARISILHINTDTNTFQKVKCSGICIATGTGSSSWYKAINSINPQVVEDILNMAKCRKMHTLEEIERICFNFNTQLQYSSEQLRLSYIIRDIMLRHIWPLPNTIYSRGFCEKLTVRSELYDGGLVIDGGIAIHFNVGTTAVLETLEEDTLRNIVLLD